MFGGLAPPGSAVGAYALQALAAMGGLLPRGGREDLHEIFMRVIYGVRSVLLCRGCDTLCTSRFMDDVIVHLVETEETCLCSE